MIMIIFIPLNRYVVMLFAGSGPYGVSIFYYLVPSLGVDSCCAVDCKIRDLDPPLGDIGGYRSLRSNIAPRTLNSNQASPRAPKPSNPSDAQRATNLSILNSMLIIFHSIFI